jgi:hypothetical protein
LSAQMLRAVQECQKASVKLNTDKLDFQTQVPSAGQAAIHSDSDTVAAFLKQPREMERYEIKEIMFTGVLSHLSEREKLRGACTATPL